MTALPVVIVGGGIAGLSCAVRLAAEGARVTLLESRRRLGGRATSFTDPRTGETLDNCQHVAMGCCAAYLDLCARLGVADRLRWTDEIRFVEPGGNTSVLRPGSLPAPLHFAASFLHASFLTSSERRAVARGMLAALRADRGSWRDRTFADWLTEHGQPRRAIERFWTPIAVSACNLAVDRLAASVALHVLQEAFLATARGARIAIPAVPLVDLYASTISAIEAAGGEVRLGAPVAHVDERRVILTGGGEIECERVVVAVPPERVPAIMSDSVLSRDARIEPLRMLAHSPILGVHLTLDRAVLDAPHAALVGCATQWVFNKGEIPDNGQRLHAVVSAADDWMHFDEPAIVARAMGDIGACFPEARDARVLAARTVKERRATFAATPDFERVRPPATCGATTIVLAGDYTDTGWPATMESAARSGYLAAAAVLDRPRSWALTAPVGPGPLAALLGGAGLRRSLALTR